MGLLGEESITVDRLDGGTYTAGRFTTGTLTQIVIRASVQPTSDNEKTQIQENPELRSKDLMGSIRIYTTSILRTIDNDATTEPDVVLYGGKKYEVFKLGDWNKLNLQHYKYIGILKN